MGKKFMKFAKNLQEWPKCPCRLWFIMQHNIIYLSLYILYANLVLSFRWSSMENRCNHCPFPPPGGHLALCRFLHDAHNGEV